jgi:hypothetical protein
MALNALAAATVVVTAGALATYRLLRSKRKELPVGAGIPEVLAGPSRVNVKTVMAVLVSLLVLGSSLFIILSARYDSESQKWAFGVAGTIVGFWFRPEK